MKRKYSTVQYRIARENHEGRERTGSLEVVIFISTGIIASCSRHKGSLMFIENGNLCAWQTSSSCCISI